MAHKSKKYRQLMFTARQLFWKHGFRRVSIEEICLQAGVSKMTFYRYFPNKTEIARAIYDQEIYEGMRNFRHIMHNRDTSPLQKMEQILVLKMQGTNDISREFLADFYNNPELGLSSHIEKKTREAWQVVIKEFHAAQKEGWLRKDFKPEGVMVITGKLSELVGDEQLLLLYGSPQALIMELSRFFTYGIMPCEK